MTWSYIWTHFLLNLLPALPWIVGGVAGLSVISFGPLGRALAQRLRHGTEDQAAILDEMAAVRGELGEVLERLDYTERLLSRAGILEDGPALPNSGQGASRYETPS